MLAYLLAFVSRGNVRQANVPMRVWSFPALAANLRIYAIVEISYISIPPPFREIAFKKLSDNKMIVKYLEQREWCCIFDPSK